MSEAPAERRARLRAEEVGLTDEQLRHREDQDFGTTKRALQAVALADAYERQSRSVPSFTQANAERGRNADARAATAQRLTADGWSKHRIADKFGVTTKTVTRWLRRPLT